jgi:hypothetical protein
MYRLSVTADTLTWMDISTAISDIRYRQRYHLYVLLELCVGISEKFLGADSDVCNPFNIIGLVYNV